MRSEKWRGQGETQLSLSYIFPLPLASSSTISGWIKNTLKLSGRNDVVDYGEHSTRGTSTSKVFLKNMLVKDMY